MPSVGGGGSSGAQTVTQSTVPWEETHPYLKQIMGDAQKLYEQNPPSMYPRSFTAQKSLPTGLAEELTIGRALGGSPSLTAGRNTLTDTLSGQYLDPTRNPMFQVGLDKVTEQYNTAVKPTTDAAFSRAGAYGGSAHNERVDRNQKALAEGLNNVNASIYGQERQNQLGSLNMVPTFNNLDYQNIGALSAVGSQRDAYNQRLIDEAIGRYDFDSNKAYENLERYRSIIAGTPSGQTSTQTTPYSSNGAAGLAGGLLSGAQMGAQMGLFGGGSSAASALPWLGGTAVASSGPITLPWLIGAGAASDITLKENITPHGTENGFNTYRFTYKDDPAKTPYIGVMAQEVMKTNPDAVFDHDGYLAVDYGKIGVTFREA